MKLSFRDLKKQTFTVDADASETVADVKKKVEQAKGSEFANPRLIYSGKILNDGQTIGSYNIKESDHIICMVQKPKASSGPSAAPAPSTPAQPTVTRTPVAPGPNTSSTSGAAPTTPSPSVAATAPTQSQRSITDDSPMMGAERQAAISNMESMGFERPQIERAMRAAFYNPDRAVEYLLTGIPENVGEAPPAARAAPTAAPAAETAQAGEQPSGGEGGDEAVNLFEAAAAAGGGRGGAGVGRGAAAQAAGAIGGAGANTGLDFLRDNPMFQQLRQLVQTQPQMLEQVLQQVAASNPDLAQRIQANPEQFIQLLSESPGGEEGEDAPLPPGAQSVAVTEEERDAIERLCRLGFERDLVIQAYFACDKNEELAANFLFEQPPDDEGGDGGH